MGNEEVYCLPKKNLALAADCAQRGHAPILREDLELRI